MTYSEQLQTWEWYNKREEILKRDNHKCQRCSDPPEQLHVHHKYYEPNLMAWEYPNEALITLCLWCHEKEEMYRRSIRQLLKEIYKLDVHAEVIADMILQVIWDESIKRGL